MNKIICGDSLKVLQSLSDNSVNCCITSPPYFGLRNYGVDGQIGCEDSPSLYVDSLVNILSEVKRILVPDGTLWLNLGDSYAGSWGNYGGQNRGRGTQRAIVSGSATTQRAYDDLTKWRPPTANKFDGIKNKDLIGVPWMVAFALRSSGWYLRQDIIWAKPNPMPESVRDRCTKSHEYVFMFAKSERYYYDTDAIREESVTKVSDRRRIHSVVLGGTDVNFWRKQDAVGKSNYTGFNRRYVPKAYRNKRDVWNVAVKPFKGAHFATFPPDLIRPMVLAGCPEGGVVLDPFFGSGTVGVVCIETSRQFIGIDLNSEYCHLAYNRINDPKCILQSI